MRRPHVERFVAISAMIAVSACSAVGPDYERPAAIVPAQYKEFKGWKGISPRDDSDKGEWWRVFGDRELDRLEAMVSVSNQTLKADEANYRQAVALIHEARAAQYPTLNFNPSFTRESPGKDLLVAELSGGWTLDVWGKVRRSVEQDGAAAQVSAATLANARLSAQSALALAYVQVRQADSLHDLLSDTVKQYQRSLDITQNQYAAGTNAKSDVITAQAQLLSAKAQLINTGVARAQNEHAIAVLTGHPPSEISVSHGGLPKNLPGIPVRLPSALLERRPDIAGAERTMQEQNAAIGVAIAGYYPDITLSGLFGYSGNPFVKQIAGANPVWSYGLALAQPILNGGLTDAKVEAARAAYEASVATYRQTVLNAFQQVEDQLVAIRLLGAEERVREQAVASAEQAVQIALNEYRAGTQTFTTVVTAETTALNEQQSLLSTRSQRMTAAVNLIVALGGGWKEAKLPQPTADSPRP